MRKQLLLLFFSLFAVMGFARTVTGVVKQASDKETIIGASVRVHGTTRGVTTDIDGKFQIDVQDGDVLDITYVGMNPVSVKVGKQTVIEVEMTDNSQVLSEVVVTAMGQTQEKKKLNFAVQSLNSDQVTAGSASNFANSLQGKVAGLQVSTGGGSPNSSTQVIIRAISSVNTSQNNEPLVIVDGVPVRGHGSSLGDINANDIENMSVLKGAAASALYGQEAANGVIMITTKSGSKDGKVTVNASASLEVSNAMRVPKLQKAFTPGVRGMYKENSSTGGWGPYMSEKDTYYDNLGGFLGTGLLQKYDMSVSGGGEKFNSYASVSYTDNQGIVPKDYKKQLTVFLKGNYKPSEQVTVQLTTNFINSKSRGFGNSMSSIYSYGINKDMKDYQTLEGHVNWAARYDNWDKLTDLERLNCGPSPYYGRYNDKSNTESNRIVINGQLTYEPIKDLIFNGKIGYDKGYSTYESYSIPRIYEGDLQNPDDDKVKDVLAKNQSLYGAYSFQPSRSEQFTALATATWKKTFAEDFTFNFLVGAEYKEVSSYEASIYGEHFQLGGDYYSFMNTDFTNGDLLKSNRPSLYHSSWNKYGYFGELRFDYKGMAQLSVTGRLDGSSRLVQAEKCQYFYPSVTGGVIFSELFHLSNEWFSYGKIRGNWAKVGKSCTPYKFTESFKNWSTFPDGGWGIDPTIGVALNLEPEMTKSWEIGADLRFFKNRTRLDLAYYSTSVDNQIVTVRVSPAAGQILQTRNEGCVENYGIEATLAQDIFKTNDFDWTVTANFSLNRGRVKSLPDQITQIDGTNYGGIFPTAFLGGSSTAITGKDYQRDPDGNVICNEDGYPLINTARQVLIGNREPDFMLGLGSNFRWKELTFGFLFDGRCGGDVVNITGSSLISNGQHHLLDKYRNREIVFNGVVANGDGTYRKNTTPVILDQNFINTYYFPVSSNFIEDGSYIRLSYVTIGYDLSKLLAKGCPVKGLNVSVTGRNLFLLTKYSGSDPQVTESGSSYGSGSGGFDRYQVPNARSFNFNLKATF